MNYKFLTTSADATAFSNLNDFDNFTGGWWLSSYLGRSGKILTQR